MDFDFIGSASGFGDVVGFWEVPIAMNQTLEEKNPLQGDGIRVFFPKDTGSASRSTSQSG
jgi:hypothetical protein